MITLPSFRSGRTRQSEPGRRLQALLLFLVLLPVFPGFAQGASGGNPTQEIQAALGAREYTMKIVRDEKRTHVLKTFGTSTKMHGVYYALKSKNVAQGNTGWAI